MDDYDEDDNDGRFPDESPVEVRYPRSKQEEQGNRQRWPWLPGTIVEQCGPDEWYVCVEARELAVLRDGRRAPRGAASRNLCYPCCFRDSSEIRPRPASSGPAGTRRGASRGPGDPLGDGGRGLRCGRRRGGGLLLPYLRAGPGPRPGWHGGPAVPEVPGDVEQAVRAAYAASVAAGQPLSQRAMAGRFGLSRRKVSQLVAQVTASGNGHRPGSEAA